MGQPMKTPINRRSKLVYVSGAITADTQVERWEHIMLARYVAIKLWEMGFTVICPHLNTMFMDGALGMDWEDWITGDLEIIERCDAVFMLPTWVDSRGANTERKHAQEIGIPVYYSLVEIEEAYPNE